MATLGRFALLLACLLAPAAPAVAAGPSDTGDGGTALPSYTREDVAAVCLDEYGMGNASLLDCLAHDDATKASLSRRWAAIDAGARKGCIARLAGMRHASYAHLDSCLRQARQDAAAAE